MENFRKYWNEMHQKHPDALLLFRHGDFYEVFGTDAVACGKILGIETKQHADRTVTAGFPYHALDTYLPKLIRAGKRVAICDYPIEPPKRGNNETIETNETKSEETMANELKVADLIGKTVTIKDSKSKYVIKSVDGDKLQADFIMDGKQPMPCPVPLATMQTMVDSGKWVIEGAAADPNGEPDPDAVGEIVDVEEVDDIKVEPAKTEPKKTEKPKKQEPKASKTKAEPKADGKLTYSTYTNKKGKQCAKIIGFGENDPAYVNAADLHGSASYERDKHGEKTFYLVFGPKYAAAAKDVCDALNAGKSFADCKAIIDKATEERKAQNADKPKGKTYTEAEVADLIKRVVAGDKEAMDIVNAMQKAA